MQSTAPRRRPLLWILSSLTLLTACGTDQAHPGKVSDLVVREHYTAARPDERLRRCADRPARRPVTNSNAIAQLLTELFAWGDDCQGKLGSTWESIDDATRRAEELNNQQALPEDPD